MCTLLQSIDGGELLTALVTLSAALLVFYKQKAHEEGKSKKEAIRKYERFLSLLNDFEPRVPYVAAGRGRNQDIGRSTSSYKSAIKDYIGRFQLIDNFLNVIMQDVLLYCSVSQIESAVAIHKRMKDILTQSHDLSGGTHSSNDVNAFYKKEYESVKGTFEVLRDFFSSPV